METFTMGKEEATRLIKEIPNSPCMSGWLKNALQTSLDRDCVDAWKDADLLGRILKARLRN